MKSFRSLLTSLKRNGLLKTLKKIARALYYRTRRFLTRPFHRACLKGVSLKNFDAIILFENNFGWNRIMKQRPQQIAENFDSNVLFLYHSHDDEDFVGYKNRIRKIKDNLFVVDFGYHRDALFEQFARFSNKYLMVYSTDHIPMDRITLYKDYRYKLLYDYVDDIDVQLCGKELYKLLSKRHRQILADENHIVFATAQKLYDNALQENPNANVTLVTNGVNYEHFQSTDHPLPDDLKPIREAYKTLIGYYGALASWFDYDLIRKISEERKDCAIVLIGLEYDKTLKQSGICKLDNVFYLGKKSYDELPGYIHFLDICTIPFLINDITRATSPVKLFEYMAAHKPIVTTALPECMRYESVFTSNSHEEFLENLHKAEEKKGDADYLALLDREAKENTWQSKCALISEIINNKEIRLQSLRQAIRDSISSGEVDRVVIWRSPFGWDVPLFQRPQHITNAFSKRRCLMIYEVTEDSDGVSDYKKQADHLLLANLSDQETLDAVLITLQDFSIPKYIQIYSTNWEMTDATMQLYIDSGYKILYEYIDDLNPALAGTEELPPCVKSKYKAMLKDDKNILVVVTANEIEKDILEKRGNKNYCFSGNGVDYDHFVSLDPSFVCEQSFLDIVGNGKVNLGYYGALASWFDYDLIREINDTDLYNIVLIGVKYDDSFDESGIGKLKNVHFIGSKKYEVLPQYAAKMDILSIPFVINDITNATSPLKLFEYMALSKPIVTSAMPECMKYDSVLVARSSEEFLALLQEACEKAKDPAYLALLQKEALENTWGKKAEIILEMLRRTEAEAAAAKKR